MIQYINAQSIQQNFDFGLIVLAVLVMAWTLPWKGVALWKAAKKGHKIWFIVLLIVNALAILEIIYIFIFSRDKKSIQSENNIKD